MARVLALSLCCALLAVAGFLGCRSGGDCCPDEFQVNYGHLWQEDGSYGCRKLDTGDADSVGAALVWHLSPRKVEVISAPAAFPAFAREPGREREPESRPSEPEPGAEPAAASKPSHRGGERRIVKVTEETQVDRSLSWFGQLGYPTQCLICLVLVIIAGILGWTQKGHMRQLAGRMFRRKK